MQKIRGKPPISDNEIETLLQSTLRTIRRHTALICLKDDWIYSGVFAQGFGHKGILTAGHCAIKFMSDERFAILVDDKFHHLWVKPTRFEHIPIGFDEVEGPSLAGPDLSFVKIKDAELIRIIESHGHGFYNLDSHREEATAIFTNPVNGFNWCVSGSPKEKMEIATQVINSEKHKLINVAATVIQGSLVGSELGQDYFDYLKIITGNSEDFPCDYSGVSGGGIWYQRFITEDGKNYRAEPVLAGITCWQSKPVIKDGYKICTLTGHSYLSIYGKVIIALMGEQLRAMKINPDWFFTDT